MYYEDLSNYSYHLKKPLDYVKNIGWLESCQPYNKGKVCVDSLKKLASIILGNHLVNAQVNRMRCMHPCTLDNCGLLEVRVGDRWDSLGAAEIWIPSKDNKGHFAFPTLVYHYIEKHDYLPPKVFIDAVNAFDLSSSYNAQEVYLDKIKGHF